MIAAARAGALAAAARRTRERAVRFGGMGAPPPMVTVVMPVRNEARFIRRSLDAVMAQDYPRDLLEIVVVDGASEDDTASIVRSMSDRHPGLRLLDNPRRIQAAALNLGIRAARGEIVVRVDGHSFVAPDYVSRCVELLSAGRAENVGGRMRPEAEGWAARGIALATSSRFGLGNSKFHYSEGECFVDTVYLGAYRRETLERIGLYDESVDVNEDYELNYRLRRAGGRILLSPRIRSTYHPRTSFGGLARQYVRYGRWKARVLRKHPGSLVWRQAVAPLLVAALVSTALAAPVWRAAGLAFAAIAGVYLLACGLAALAAARSEWRLVGAVALAFVTLHLSWGTGMWWGLVAPPPPSIEGR
jgi:succinoglycan biosynthesis protein ExoA